MLIPAYCGQGVRVVSYLSQVTEVAPQTMATPDSGVGFGYLRVLLMFSEIPVELPKSPV